MLGCDAEQFVRRKSDGVLVPAEKVLSGGKGDPTILSEHTLAHPDNVTAECALAKPCKPQDFYRAVRKMLDELQEAIGNDYELVPQGSALFTRDILSTSLFAQEVGCDPDYDDTGDIKICTLEDLGLYRCAGFHIHFDVMAGVPATHVAKVVDCTLGVASIGNGWDTGQGFRRRLYGSPSRHRPKSYGIEWRVWSSKVINFLEEAQELIEKVATGLEQGDPHLLSLPYQIGDVAKHIIMEEDETMARAVIEEYHASLNL